MFFYQLGLRPQATLLRKLIWETTRPAFQHSRALDRLPTCSSDLNLSTIACQQCLVSLQPELTDCSEYDGRSAANHHRKTLWGRQKSAQRLAAAGDLAKSRSDDQHHPHRAPNH